ncbi:MAG: phosphatidylserine decarboxylase family protein [Deltaproteobacteria bacterium]|jgi:phosphatidylserine decarboxylase|nr:phosphatidylserine decarboxylase family protein [Deltaproteobacteria bacterium]
MNPHSWPDPPGQTAFPVARAGYPPIFAAAFVTLILALLGMTYLTLLGLLVTFCFCGFFRDPDRVIPNQPDAIVSPADGKVISVGPVDGTSFCEGSCQKISIFMSVFNVHVNRVPFDGKVKRVGYYPGKFFSANLDKASLQNEHNAVFLETAEGKQFCTVQVAGLIARRIICKVQSGDDVCKGQRFGMICFGSRLDVYLPDDVEIKVTVGDKVKAGSSVIGRFAMP